MKKLKLSVTTGYEGAKRTDEIEVDDDTTKKEAEEMALDWVWQNIDFNWNEDDFPEEDSQLQGE